MEISVLHAKDLGNELRGKNYRFQNKTNSRLPF